MQDYEPTILLVDDEDNCLRVISDVFELEGIECITANSGEKALEIFELNDIDIVVTDIKMPGVSGLDLLKEVKARKPETVVIMMTGYGSIGNAIESIKQGAYQYIIKPIVMDDFLAQIRDIMNQIQNGKPTNVYKPDSSYFNNNLKGTAFRIQNINKIIDLVSKSDLPLLITGESGTGKELAALQIHKSGNRANQNFVTLNCTTCKDVHLENDLFGSKTGSKPSEIEKANGGTFYLEEIGNLKSSLQTKLLEVIKTGEIKYAGNPDPVKVDVRFIASTSHNLEQEVEEGVFDAELFHVFNSITLRMPALREITNDIPVLAQHFANEYNSKSNKKIKINKETLATLQNYSWPGNVRELINVIRSAVSICESNEIMKFDLPAHLTNGKVKEKPGKKEKRSSLLLADVEQDHIMGVLDMAKGNKSMAATMLGIHRDTLLRKLKKYGVD